MAFDEAAARRVERLYATAEMAAQRHRVSELLAPTVGQAVLDLGCGLGHLTADLAELLGADGRVTGVDPSPAMLERARDRLGDHEASGRVTLTEGAAEAIPLGDASVDAVAVVQVLEYVDDVAAALGEIRRVLRPAGRVVIVDTDWRSCVWHTPDRDLTDRVLRAWEGHFAQPHLPTALRERLGDAGFTDVAAEVLPILTLSTDRDTYDVGMVGVIADFVARTGALTADEADTWRRGVRAQAKQGPYFFSLCRYVFTATR